MSKKYYQMFRIDELVKKYGESTQAKLTGIGWSPDRPDGIGINAGGTSEPSRIELTFPDNLTPKLGTTYLIAVEPIEIPVGVHQSDYQQTLVNKRREVDLATSTPGVGRKFR